MEYWDGGGDSAANTSPPLLVATISPKATEVESMPLVVTPRRIDFKWKSQHKW